MVSSNIGEADPKGRGRPRGFDETEALQAIMRTFWRQGYAATSLDDLVTASGAPRGTLYRLYGGKSAMFIAALDHYGAAFTARVDKALAEAPDARTAMAALLEASIGRLASPDWPDGCLRCNGTLEMAGRNAGLDVALSQANALFESNLARVVDRAVSEGRVSHDAAPRVTRFFATIWNGLVTLSRSGAERPALEDVAAEALAHLDDPQ